MEKTRDEGDEGDEGEMSLDLCSFNACLQPCQWLDSSVLEHTFGLMSMESSSFPCVAG